MARTAQIRPIELTPENVDIIQRWNILAEQLSTIKASEMPLRQELVAKLGDASKLEGTDNLGLNDGWKLKIQKIQNYKAIDANMEIRTLLDAIYAIDPSMPARLIVWKPDLSESVYKKELLPLLELHPELKPLAAAAIEIKPGAPVVELIPPKG